MPGDAPITIPVAPPTVATAGLPLLHTPPLTELASVVTKPTQVLGLPVLGANELTVIALVVIQPAPTPVTMPLLVPTVATEALLLLHTPPVVALEKVVVNPWQTLEAPVMGNGNA